MISTEEWQRLHEAGGHVELPGATLLQLLGPDAQRYLNGQVTADIRRIAPGHAAAACFCNHKGRLEALTIIGTGPDGAWHLSADAALRDFLPARVEKYLIADDASLTDVSNDFVLVHGIGGAAPPPEAAVAFQVNRFGLPGTDWWLPADSLAAWRQRSTLLSPEIVDLLRIDRGRPAWEPELSAGVLPPEARLDEYAIDYHKGCYTGQEVISRLRSVGQVTKRLERLVATGGAVIEPGWSIFAMDAAGTRTVAGTITSAAWHPGLKTGIALGYVRRSAAGARLEAGPSDDCAVVGLEIRMPLDDTTP